MISDSINIDRKLILPAAATAIILSVSQIAPLLLLGVLIFAIVYLTVEKSYRAFLYIVLLLSITSDLGEQIRIGVNLLVFGLMFFEFFKTRGLDIKLYKKIPYNLIGFVLLVLFSMLLSILLSGFIFNGAVYFIKQFIFFILIYLFYYFIESEDDILKYIYAIITAGLILSVSIIYSFLHADLAFYYLQVVGFTISGGYFSNVAAAGGILTVSISFTYYLIIKNQIAKKTKIINSILLLLQTAALLLTNSRAAFLGAFVSIVFITLAVYKDKRKTIVSAVLVLITIAILLDPKIVDVLSIFIRSDRVFENPRYNLWDISFHIIKDNFLFGIGPGTFQNYMYKYVPVMLNSWAAHDIKYIYENATVGHSHNFILFKFSELGVLGLITSILLPYLFFSLGIKLKNYFKIHSIENHLLVITILGIGTGLFARSFFEATGFLSYGWITRDLPFWLLFSFIIFLHQKYINQKPKDLT